MAELKPCPFCGCKEIASDKYDIIRHKVCCRSCSAQIYRGTQKEAEKAWNRRAEDVTA